MSLNAGENENKKFGEIKTQTSPYIVFPNLLYVLFSYNKRKKNIIHF